VAIPDCYPSAFIAIQFREVRHRPDLTLRTSPNTHKASVPAEKPLDHLVSPHLKSVLILMIRYRDLVDPDVDVLYGPHKIQRIGTVTVPHDLQRAVGLAPGDRVHWALSTEVPGALLLIPAKQLERAMADVLKAIRKAGR